MLKSFEMKTTGFRAKKYNLTFHFMQKIHTENILLFEGNVMTEYKTFGVFLTRNIYKL